MPLGLPRDLYKNSPCIGPKGESLQLRLPATEPSPQQPVTAKSYTHRRSLTAATTASMSVGSKSFPTRRDRGEGEAVVGENGDGAVVREESKGGSRNSRYNRCFSGLELSIGPGPLKDKDAGRLKGQIRRWAKAVVAYARQISFGSPRSSRSRSRSASSPTSGGGDTPSSATFRASKSSRLGGANNEPPT